MARTPAWANDVELNTFNPPFRRSGPARWKAVLLGLFVVASGTFVAGYYLPLHQAHEKLTGEHRSLVGKAQAAEQSLKQTRSELTDASAKRDELQAERDKREASTQAERKQQETLKNDVTSKLAKLTSKGQVAVNAAANGNVVVSLSQSLLFLAKKNDVTPKGKAALCDLAKAAGSHALDVIATTGTDPTATWSDASARAASVAETLSEACRVAPSQLSATAAGAGLRAPVAEQLQKQLPSRIDVEISSR